MLELVSNEQWRVQGALTRPNSANLLAHLPTTTGNVVTVSLADVTLCDTVGVAVLLEWQRRLKRQGKQMQLTDVPGSVQRLAELGRVQSLLDITPGAQCRTVPES